MNRKQLQQQLREMIRAHGMRQLLHARAAALLTYSILERERVVLHTVHALHPRWKPFHFVFFLSHALIALYE
jgi:hypothetical protein